MITLVEALNYRCLKYIRRPLQHFHVLVGSNASGKTTFMNVITFLGDLLQYGLSDAISHQTSNPIELLFQHRGSQFELAVEATIPSHLRGLTSRPLFSTIRYEVAVGFDETLRSLEFKAERLLLKRTNTQIPAQRTLFPITPQAPSSLAVPRTNTKYIINKVPGGNDNYYSEVYSQSGKGWTPSFKLGVTRSAFGNMPADDRSFPVAIWFQQFLIDGVQGLTLNSHHIRKSSPPSKAKGLSLDGSNLPWVIDRLYQNQREHHSAWIQHLRTVLPDLQNITTIERTEDRHRYMTYEYNNGLVLPSWMVSDGTLRLTALTLLAYVPNLTGIFLVEEPENGIHPTAVAAAYDSLSSLYDAQVLMASHSPVILSAARMNEVLCFAKDPQGATDIVLGSEHPDLRNWQDDADLGLLLASGILG